MKPHKRRIKAAETTAALTGEDHLCGWQPVGRISPRRDYFERHCEPADRFERRKRLLGAYDHVFGTSQYYWTKTRWDMVSTVRRVAYALPKWQRSWWVRPYFDLRNIRRVYRRCWRLKGHKGGHQWERREAWRK